MTTLNPLFGTTITRNLRQHGHRGCRHRHQRRLFLEPLEDRRLLAAVATDKLNYHPGDTAVITATDFQVGEEVTFQVLHIDGTPNTGNGHDPWTVRDGSAADLDGLTDGNIKTTWYVDPDDSFGSTFELTAEGLSSGLTASTTFTDAISINFRQAANDDGEPGGLGDINWITSILQGGNSMYFEGMSVMQRVLVFGFTDTDNDQIITLDFAHDATKAGIHAYDWLTSWDQAITAAQMAGVPFDNVQVDPNQNTLHDGTENNLTLAEACDEDLGAPPDNFDDICTNLRTLGTDGAVYYVDVAVPDDPFVSFNGGLTQTKIDDYEATFGNRTIRVYANQPITSGSLTLTHSVASGTDSGDSDIHYALSITFAGAVTTSTQLMIEMAGHLAAAQGPGGWGAGFGSSNISGGPYHFNLEDIDDQTIGNQDNQIAGSDIQIPNGSIAWEKRATDANPVLLGGATFTITPDPTDGMGSLTVVDNGPFDADPDDGQFLVNNVPPGTYTVTETVAPTGYAIDDDATRSVTVSESDLFAVIGTQGQDDPGDTDESDFHNRLGSISWEKRATDANPVLLAGATFTISPDPTDGVGTLTVVDGGLNDADGAANGVLVVNNVLAGTYTITETVAPSGYAIDDDATRSVTVAAGENAVIGTQGQDDPGNTDESDFHNVLGSISWEKRATDANPVLLAGATFTISPDPTDGVGTLTVVDGGLNDADGAANGVLVVNNVLAGTYTITETVAPTGYAIDDDATRSVTVAAGEHAVIGTQGQDDPGNTDESDFHNVLASISWEKRATDSNPVLLAGATFTITPDPTDGVGTLTVVDGGLNDADGAANGVLVVNNVLAGTYTITETVAPTGYAIDDDATRSVTVAAGENAVIGTQGQDDPGNTDESDFHNRLGSISWEKRATDANPVLLAGATFTISPDPTDGVGTLTVVDGGLNDADGAANGVLVVNNVLAGTYTITETVAPTGYAIDDDATRSVTVAAGENAVIGTQGQDDPGNTDESDFHNVLASISWEKRATDSNPVLLAGATFSITPDPIDGVGTLTVVDGGLNDADGAANGVLVVNNVLPGTYTITETVAPTGYAIDDDATRVVTVAAGESAVIGTQGQDDPGNTDESDFHNRLGSISWEKRATDANPVLLAGATFTISPDPTDGVGTLTVVDGGLNDADGAANGVLVVNNVLAGTYTITETVAPAGYAIDNDATRSVTVAAGENAVIGTQGQDDPGDTDESDFHNGLGSITWEKRATDTNPVLLAGATFTISPDPIDGVGTLTVVDGGLNDADGAANGVLVVNNVLAGTYTITETVAPTGYAIDDDATRVVTVAAGENAVIGIQGQDDPGNTDESDFHNRLASISWEKRATDANPVLLAGATFTISPDPTDGVGTLTVVDGGLNDADGAANGVLVVNNVLAGTYTITETVAPAGYAIDDDATRSVTVAEGENAVIGTQGQDDPGNTDESDFHNVLGSISWEKRATDANPVLLAGATFTITPDPTDGVGTLTVVDGGLNDADGAANGVLVVNNVLAGTYTITETVAPAGYAIDDDATRSVTVAAGENAVIGTQGQDDPGDTDESDFHNGLGSITWEKRATDTNPVLLAGATFTITPDPTDGVGTLTVVDGGLNDADGAANGVLVVNNVLAGTYTITETIAPVGYAIDDDATRVVTVAAGEAAIIGTLGQDDPGNTDESDFHNVLGSIAWEKRSTESPFLLVGGATFEISPDPLDGFGVLTVVDNGPFDADSDPGQFLVINVLAGLYAVTETVPPPGFELDVNPTRVVLVAPGQNAVIGIEGQNDELDFHNEPEEDIIVIGPDKSPQTNAQVKVVNKKTGEVLVSFLAYEPGFLGGTRVATGDLTGDGIDEIITAPGRSRAPQIRVFTQQGVELIEFRTLAYASTFKGGVHVAVGDVNGDGRNDIITAPSYGKAEVRVFFRNTFASVDPIPNTPSRKFLAFPSTFIGGAFVRAADVGRLNGTFSNTLDGKAEVIVGSGPGIKAAVKVFVVNGSTGTLVRTINPFSNGGTVYKGGVNFDVADLTGDDIPDLVIGSEAGGNSRVETWVWNGSANLVKTGSFMAYSESKPPVRVAALDENSDGVFDQIATVQGPNGTTGEIRCFDINTINPLSVTQTNALSPFPGPWFIAALKNPATQEPDFTEAEGEADDFAPLASQSSTPAGSLDLNGDGAVTVSDATLVINQINSTSSGITAPSTTGSAYDLDGDGQVSALDALLIYNAISQAAAAIKPALADGTTSSEEEYTADVDSLFAAIGETDQA